MVCLDFRLTLEQIWSGQYFLGLGQQNYNWFTNFGSDLIWFNVNLKLAWFWFKIWVHTNRIHTDLILPIKGASVQ